LLAYGFQYDPKYCFKYCFKYDAKHCYKYHAGKFLKSKHL